MDILLLIHQFDHLANRPSGRLAAWPLGRLADGNFFLIRLFDHLADWPLGRLAAWLMGNILLSHQFGHLADRPIGRLAAWPLGQLTTCSFCWSINLPIWPIAHLPAWMLGCLADGHFFVDPSVWALGRLAA